MQPHVWIQVPKQGPCQMKPGELIGRLATMQVCINHPTVSEAHALLSLRGGQLVLMPLRRPLRIRGQATKEAIVLQEDMEISLSSEIQIKVLSVHLPTVLPMLQIDQGAPQLLLGGRPAVDINGTLHGAEQYPEGTALKFWSNGEDWFVDWKGEQQRCDHGCAWNVGGHSVQFLMEPAQGAKTIVDGPRRFVSREEAGVFEVWMDERPVLTFTKKQAELMSLLVTAGGTVGWLTLAKGVWSQDGARIDRYLAAKSGPEGNLFAQKRRDIEDNLRNRYHKLLNQIRNQLKEVGIDSMDLLKSSGDGMLEFRPRKGEGTVADDGVEVLP